VHGIYRAQLQAIASLAPEFEIRVLLPYVADLAELQYWQEDIRQQIEVPLAIGAMAETPAAALQLREWLEVADFVAIGCNDLMQCLFGADRDQPELHHYLDPYAPALYRFMRQIADTAGHRLDAVQLCGVLPQLPGILPLLLGLGYRVFSVEAASLPHLRATIAATHAQEAQVFAEQICRARSSAVVRALLEQNRPRQS
jgi:phosphoenolpyruvate-protein kinase (PTS system EI component)